MLNILKKINILLIILLFPILAGCTNLHEPEPPAAPLLSTLPTPFADADELLATMAMVKFSEFSLAEIPDSFGNIFGLEDLTYLFRPNIIPPGIDMDLGLVTIFRERRVSFLNYCGEWVDRGGSERMAHFHWSRGLSLEGVSTVFGRGGDEEFIKRHNGIDYYIVRWWVAPDNPAETDGYDIAWVQHGQRFRTFFTAGFTFDEMLAFSYAIPITSWELDGDAVSVSIQGMDEVTITALGGTTGRSEARQPVIVVGNTLYIASGARSGELERIGYRWLINAATNRFQYVLEPGVYEFRATGVAGNPGLLTQHFGAGDVVLSTDFGAEVASPEVTQFLLTVSAAEVIEFTTDFSETEPTHIVIEIISGAWKCTNDDNTIHTHFLEYEIELKATVYPLDANQQVAWSSVWISGEPATIFSVDQSVVSRLCRYNGHIKDITATAVNGISATVRVYVEDGARR